MPSGRPARFECTRVDHMFVVKRVSEKLGAPPVHGVSMIPGPRRFTRMPLEANSAETLLVKPINPCFEASCTQHDAGFASFALGACRTEHRQPERVLRARMAAR
jgi:hypothetical protein